MIATDLFARRATLSRSLRLLGEFRYEQADPARFYGALAKDTAAMVADLWQGAGGRGGTVLDISGGPGYFATAFEANGMHYIGVEPDRGDARRSRDRGDGRLRPRLRNGIAVRRLQRRHCLSSDVAEQCGIRGVSVTRCCASPNQAAW